MGLDDILVWGGTAFMCAAAVAPLATGVLQGYRDRLGKAATYAPSAAAGIAATGIPLAINDIVGQLFGHTDVSAPELAMFAAYGVAYGAVTQAFGYAVGKRLRRSSAQ